MVHSDLLANGRDCARNCSTLDMLSSTIVSGAGDPRKACEASDLGFKLVAL